MKMRNKVLAGLMALVLMVAVCVTGWADDSNIIDIQPLVLVLLDNSASEWYKTDDMRTLLVAGFVFDVFASENQNLIDILTESLISGTTYVAKGETFLNIYSFSEKGSMLGMYAPATGSLFVSTLNGINKSATKSVMDTLKSDGSFTSYYKVNNTDIIETWGLIIEALSD